MMILRQAVLRQGRRVVLTPRRTWTRWFASEVGSGSQSLDNSLNETRSIEPSPQDSSHHPVWRNDRGTSAAEDFDTRKEALKVVKQQQSHRYQEKLSATFGSDVTPHYKFHEQLQNPPRPSEITLELLMAAQSHLGHSTSLWNPMNSRYIFGVRQGIHIISLETTAAHLRRACRIVRGVAQQGGLILFVGTRPGQDRTVVQAAKNSGGCHLFEKWLPGSITNAQQVLRDCELKAVDEWDRELKGWDEELRELPALKPDLVVCMNPLENWVMLRECGLYDIPTIGVIDTDADPTWVTYPIPANDDSQRCIQVIAGALGMAGKEGQEARRARASTGHIPYETVDLESMRIED